MLVSIEWLKSLLPGLGVSARLDDAEIEAVAARLTGAGLEVEGKARLGAGLDGVVVALVRKVEPHPKADKLRLATVFDGTLEQTVVCGAPNVAEGQKVALARLGTTLPNGMTMERRRIRGVPSEGMLCAEDELGLSNDHEGILVLPADAKEGAPLADALGLRDVVLELGVTPNRPDALSHLGVARELAALLDLATPVVSARLDERGTPASQLARVRIEDPEGCARYAGRVVTGCTIRPSPRWVQDRLRALGQRPISNIVDATNLVLLELGQPLHAFDLDRLAGAEIRVRRAEPGESIALLDGSKKRLHPSDLVIADAEAPVALAGVMGGSTSEVSAGDGEGRPSTTRVLLESAWFDPASVRRTARRHGLHTEASHRFERGADPGMVETALDRCAELIAAWSGGTVHPGRVLAEGMARARRSIPIRPGRASLLLGRPVDTGEIVKTLSRLGLEEVPAPASSGSKSGGGLELTAGGAEGSGREETLWFVSPTWRVDLEIEADLIEEVGRLAGYDAVPMAMPPTTSEPWRGAPERDPEAEARACLVGEGHLETISLAFASPQKAELFLPPERSPVVVANPLGEESRWMRPSLLPALLEAARHNQDLLPSITDLRLFEIGRTFGWGTSTELPEEISQIAVLLRGRRSPRSWASGGELVDPFDLKGVVEALVETFRVEPRYETAEVPYLHPRSATRLVVGLEGLGVMGEVHPDVAARFGLEGPPVLVAELSLDTLAAARGREARHRPLPKLPPAQRDLSFFIGREVEAVRVLDLVQEVAPPELESVRIFDVYEGRGVPEGMKSLAFELVFRAPDRTLADTDVDAAQAAIVRAVSDRLGGRLRDRSS